MSRLNIEDARLDRVKIGSARTRYDARMRSQNIASYATAGAQTYTAADILGGLIVRDTAGGARTDVLPSAALLVAAVAKAFGVAEVGMLFKVHIINGADAAETLTISEGAGGGWDANQLSAKTIPQNTEKDVYLELTGVAAGSEAYVAYM
jgi:hypothetical protein